MEFRERVADFIQEHRLLEAGQRLVVGVSGGPDSVCLLDCLVHLGYQPVPVYVDHGLRSESREEGRFVTELAGSYGLKAIVRQVDVPAVRKQEGGSLEQQARTVRYQQLLLVVHENALHTLATAHQADDQIETVLMHLLRGSGVAGLRGMRPCTDTSGWFASGLGDGKRLVRPLLAVDSQEVLGYLEDRGLAYRQDPSNKDTRFLRNRVRAELIPYLESYNPAIRSNLMRLSKIMGSQSEWLEKMVANSWHEVVRMDEADQMVLDQAAFLELPEVLQSELMRMVLARLRLDRIDPDYGLIQSAVSFCQGGTGKMTLAAGVNIQQMQNQVIVAAEGARLQLPQFPQMISDTSQPLPLPGEVDLANGWKLTSTLVDLTPEERERWLQNRDDLRAAMDPETLPEKLVMRQRKEGDRMRPLGMSGTIKLSDLFINERVPAQARVFWPVIAQEDEIIWVVGLRMGDDYRLSRSSTRALVLEVEAPPIHG